jgi:hypothetical protein
MTAFREAAAYTVRDAGADLPGDEPVLGLQAARETIMATQIAIEVARNLTPGPESRR